MIFRWLDQPPVKILLLLFPMVSDNDNSDLFVGYSLDAL